MIKSYVDLEQSKAYEGNYKTYTELINRLEDVKDVIKKQNYGIAMDILCKPYPEYQITASIELKEESEDERIRKAIINEISLLEKESVIEQEKNVYQSWIAWLEKKGEQKPVIEMKTPEESLGISSEEYNKIVDECIYGDDKSAWSEEDETKIKSIITLLKSPALCTMDGNKGIIDESIKYLKSIKDRVLPQPKQEWSEKDEKMLQSCINIFQSMGLMKAYIKWLNSLKERVQPQNRWKPSDEQMEALRQAAYEPEKNWSEELQSLYCNLKKI